MSKIETIEKIMDDDRMESTEDSENTERTQSFESKADEVEKDLEIVPQPKGILGHRIEPVILLLFFCFNLASVVYQNQIIYMTCTAIYEYSETTCNMLGTGNKSQEIQDIEQIVQPYALNIFTVRQLMDAIIPAIVSLIIGPWSDKFGRKPLMIASISGFFLANVLLALFTYLTTQFIMSPWIYILIGTPPCIVGGICTLLSGIYCFTTDITTRKQRPLRLTLVGGYISIGLFLGSLASGYVLEATNSTSVFVISTVLIGLTLLYVIFFIEETLSPDKMQKTGGLRGLFQFSLIKSMFKALIERRPNHNRAILWLIIAALCTGIFANDGPVSVVFLFVRKQFSWTIKEYTAYNATSTVVGTIAGIGGVKLLQKYLGFTQTSLALLGVACYIVDSIVKLTATEPWHMYLAIVLSLMSGPAMPMCRSMISTTVPPSDIGKLYALATAFEHLMPLGAAPLYSFVYRKTLDFYPGAFYGTSVLIYSICFVMIAILYVIDRRRRNAKKNDLNL